MSGGSFGHLWLRDNARDLANSYELIEDMAEYLEAHGPEAEDAAKCTRRVLALIDKAYEVAQPLLGVKGVWKAAEWARSGDSLPEHLTQALQALNLGGGVEPRAHLTHDELIAVCRDIGADLCGACAEVFFTGVTTSPHSPLCQGKG